MDNRAPQISDNKKCSSLQCHTLVKFWKAKKNRILGSVTIDSEYLDTRSNQPFVSTLFGAKIPTNEVQVHVLPVVSVMFTRGYSPHIFGILDDTYIISLCPESVLLECYPLCPL